MNIRITLTALAVSCMGFFYSSFAQISAGGQPLSFSAENNLALSDIPEETIAALDLGRLADEDYENETAGGLPRFAKLMAVNFNLTNSGTWKTQPNGDRVWRLKIIADDALATSLYYNNFHLPAGSKLYIWNEDGTQVIGAFNEFNNHESGKFATELIYGETCYLEYTEPAAQAGQGVISISHVAYAYRYVEVEGEQRGGDACEVDINCSPEGTNWQDEKKGVVRMQVVDGGSAGWCSASLVNNTNLDCKGYILSAFHCGEGSSTSDFTQYIFYFNYERPGCGTGTASTSQSMTGCVKRADSNDGGGASGSDFMLLELNNSIPSNYNPYYNGWNANNTASSSGVSIHHPAGGRKKVSTYTQALTTASYGVANTHWRVVWAATTNGHGVTEGGSSGSPIFNSSGQIVGTLTGGSSYCNATTSPDYYGKVSYHWTNNPNTAGQKLKVWLDPGNTGALTLNGTYAPCQQVPSLDAGISAIVNPSGSSCATSITPVVTLKNFGATTLTAVTITTTVDGGASANYSWTGSLATNATVDVTLPARTVAAGVHTFNATTSAPNGGTDVNNTNNSSSSSFTVTVANNNAYLIVNTDNSGSQTTWQVRDGSNNVVASGGPYGNNIQVVEEICLNNGCYTFTIYDSGNNGICCNNGTGSYSLGDAEAIDIITGGQFTASESTAFCLTAPGTCDTIVQTNFANGTPIIYGATSGYISGSNNYGDKEKAQMFDVTTPVYVQDVIIWFGAKEYVSGNTASKVTVNLRQANGTGTATTGTVNTAPGTLLATKDLLITRIDTSGFLNIVRFTSPVLVSADYAVGVNFTTLGTNDQVGIVSSTDGDANLTQLAWEMWSDNTWHSMLSAWSNAIDGDLDFGIFPIECANLVTGVEEVSSDFMVFPNPATEELTIVCESVVGSQQSVVNILSATGQLVYTSSINNQLSTIDVSSLASGIYFVQVVMDGKVSVKKVVVRK